jgi:toxin ParE1/3/4
MARFRLSALARADLAHILATSAERWGIEGRRRYSAMLSAAMRKVAADPAGRLTRDRAELSPGIRSFHVPYARSEGSESKVKNPVHILYYRVVRPGVIEIAGVLHERMEPSRHLGAGTEGVD